MFARFCGGQAAPGQEQREQADRHIDAALTAFGRTFATEAASSDERAAVMRLMIAEAPHFPALLRTPPEDRPVQRALADRPTELGARGLLDVPDPSEAAEFLGLLVTSRVNHRSWCGSVPLGEPEIEELVAGGVRVFLRAYGPGAAH